MPYFNVKPIAKLLYIFLNSFVLCLPGVLVENPGPAGTKLHFFGNLNIVNKMSMGDLWTIYIYTFIMIFAAIEASFVHMLLDTPDFTPLPDTLLAYF